jgi:tetratricopeptide (TPR) repeat protein
MRSKLFASTFTIVLGVTTPIVSAIVFPDVAVAQSIAEQKKEADRLFSLGLKKDEEIEKLKESSRNLDKEDIELRDKLREKIFSKVNKIRAEIVRDYLIALAIYQESKVKAEFPLESLQGEQKILLALISIDYDNHRGHERSSYLIEAQTIRKLAIRILESYQNPDFRMLFPVESHLGEQNIIINLMDPSNGSSSVLIREQIFTSQEVLKLLEQVLENSRNPDFRDKFPLESRLVEQNILTELNPEDRSMYRRRMLLSPQKRLNLWRNLKESYLDPKFKVAFPRASRLGEGNALIQMGLTSLFELKQPKQALIFFQKGALIARETGNLLLASKTMSFIISVYWNLEEYREVIQSYEQWRTIIREISNRIIDKSDPIINKELLNLKSEDQEQIIHELQQMEFSWSYSIATAYLALGEPKRAIELYQKFFDLNKYKPDDLGPLTRGQISNLGIAYWLSGQYEEATKIS